MQWITDVNKATATANFILIDVGIPRRYAKEMDKTISGRIEVVLNLRVPFGDDNDYNLVIPEARCELTDVC